MRGHDPGAGSPQSREEVWTNLLRKGTSSRFPELARSGEHLQGPVWLFARRSGPWGSNPHDLAIGEARIRHGLIGRSLGRQFPANLKATKRKMFSLWVRVEWLRIGKSSGCVYWAGKWLTMIDVFGVLMEVPWLVRAVSSRDPEASERLPSQCVRLFPTLCGS